MIVVPLVFSSLVVGVAGIGDIRKLGRVGLEVVRLLPGDFGDFGGHRIDSGEHHQARHAYRSGNQGGARSNVTLPMRQSRSRRRRKAAPSLTPLMQVVETIVPSNPFAAMAGVPSNPSTATDRWLAEHAAPDVLCADHRHCHHVDSGSGHGAVLARLQALYEITAKIIEIIMKFAPFAVACLLFNNTARFGLDLLQALGWFIVTVLLGLSLHMFGVYSISIAFLSRISPIDFFRRIKTVILTAFSTSSSNATLPTALRVSEQNLGVPQEINSFVLTVGATANQNGTALYEGVTVLFLAQLAGVDLSLGQQLMVVYLAILGGIGTAGVPSGSIPFIIGVLVTIGVNPALIAIILGVDRILDMCRTTLNVAGDITAATYVARSEGYELLKPHEPAIVRAGVGRAT